MIRSMLHQVELDLFDGDAGERILAAAVIVSSGDVSEFLEALELMRIDWRDLLIEAELAGEDWALRLDAIMGSE